ncbi:EamA family transporter [Enorma massiliensis]|uniref:Multidrug ABC transporter n=1 Tax=Enorma massiliensis TaxID=1472761 RepID=A0A1Y3UE23_9ACTN|nr:EamA family transporter [Enorma massiliensis]OUN44619.1 multidrug ABC transporter [Enorma massiliensis]
MAIDLRYAALLLLGVFISSISQVMLKKSALKTYDSKIKEYLNPLVIVAYILFVGTTFLSIFAYRGIPLSMGPILEATSYIYVTIFGIVFFNEKMSKKKWIALVLIITGIALYSIGA